MPPPGSCRGPGRQRRAMPAAAADPTGPRRPRRRGVRDHARQRRGLYQHRGLRQPAAPAQLRDEPAPGGRRYADHRALAAVAVPGPHRVHRVGQRPVRVADRERRVGPGGPAVGGPQQPLTETLPYRGRPADGRGPLDHLGRGRGSPVRYSLGSYHPGEWYGHLPVAGTHRQLRARHRQQLAEQVRVDGPAAAFTSPYPYHHAVSQIMVAQHDRPPCQRDTRLC